MRPCTTLFSAAVIATAFGVTLAAQKTVDVHPGKGGSPHVRTEATIDGAAISVEYGRPGLKGRTPGKDIDPYEGKEWRTGADEQTTLVTNRPLKFGTLAVPAGTYRAAQHPREGTVAADHQQAREGMGHSVSRGAGSRPRTDDDGQGAGASRAPDHHARGHRRRAARCTSIGAPRAPAFRSRLGKTRSAVRV